MAGSGWSWRGVLVVALLALSGCGRDTGPAGIVPQTAPLYLDFHVGAESEAAPSEERFLAAVTGRRFGRADVVVAGFRKVVPGSPLDRRALASWGGERAAWFFVPSGRAFEGAGAMAIEVDDEEAAAASVSALAGPGSQERSHRDVSYRVGRGGHAVGLIDGHLLAAENEQAMRAAIDASEDGSLGEADRSADAFEVPGAEPFARMIVDGARAAPAFSRLAGRDGAALSALIGSDNRAGYLRLTPDAATIDVAGPSLPAQAPPTLADIPAGDLSLVVAAADLGNLLADRLAMRPTWARAAEAVRRRAGVDLEREIVRRLAAQILFVQGDPGSESDTNSSARLFGSTRETDRLIKALARTGRRLRDTKSSETEVTAQTEGAEPFVQLNLSLPGPYALFEPLVELDRTSFNAEIGAPGGADTEFGETPAFRDARRRLRADPTAWARPSAAPRLLRRLGVGRSRSARRLLSRVSYVAAAERRSETRFKRRAVIVLERP